MTATMQTPFPHIRSFVPEKCKPWLYVFIACCFQLSGGRYAGALNALIGAHGNMREDIMMCVFANLSGMALWFPMLFRMKFRFANKTLLMGASLTVILTNLLTMTVTTLPLLWLCCFVEGIAKIQGTFECMSNIQLWLTPKRDMRVFFPCLHVIILSAICGQTLLSAYFGYIGCWQLMHGLVIGLHGVVLLLLACCWRHWLMPCTPMGQPTPVPLQGIDWASCLLWGCLLVETAGLLTYGEFFNWYRQTPTWLLTGAILITLGLIVLRMSRVEHPYISPKVFTRFRYVKGIFLLIILFETILGTEHVLEDLFKEHILGYNMLTSAQPTWAVWVGNMTGCWFSWRWMTRIRHNAYIRLGIIGICAVGLYVVLMYFRITPTLNIEALYLPLFCRGFAYACMSIVLMTVLCDAMDFEHFFMGLMLFNALHMVIGGCIGSSIYGHLLNYYCADTVARSLQPVALLAGDSTAILCVAMKQIYGLVAFVCVALIAALAGRRAGRSAFHHRTDDENLQVSPKSSTFAADTR